jgi:CubicO group peptidase (beta-lactamase class C family)
LNRIDAVKLLPGFALLIFLSLLSPASSQGDPAGSWQRADATAKGWSGTRLQAARDYSKSLRPTAVVIIQDGRIVSDWGDMTLSINVASVRKSLLSALYGIFVSEGRIKLDATLQQLGINDKDPGLSQAEKQATVRDLLSARSGIYHPAAYETSEMASKRPQRGSHPPGTFWFYNNWDFNALGTIYQQKTGEDIFKSFDARIARPLGMEDFTWRHGRYVTEAVSIHNAYPFNMSARDLARFGQLFLQRGQWNGKQIIPEDWVRQSTTWISDTDRPARGYGYMWWALPAERWGKGAFFAAGNFGQFVAVLPEKQLVVVQTVDRGRNTKGIKTSDFLRFLRMIMEAAP